MEAASVEAEEVASADQEADVEAAEEEEEEDTDPAVRCREGAAANKAGRVILPAGCTFQLITWP
jgi:hypothetical protein